MRFWKKVTPQAIVMIPEGHKRIPTMADKFNGAISAMNDRREDLLAEIADKQEELRQLELGLKAMRAGLQTIADDPTISALANLRAKDNVAESAFDQLERDIAFSPIYGDVP